MASQDRRNKGTALVPPLRSHLQCFLETRFPDVWLQHSREEARKSVCVKVPQWIWGYNSLPASETKALMFQGTLTQPCWSSVSSLLEGSAQRWVGEGTTYVTGDFLGDQCRNDGLQKLVLGQVKRGQEGQCHPSLLSPQAILWYWYH